MLFITHLNTFVHVWAYEFAIACLSWTGLQIITEYSYWKLNKTLISIKLILIKRFLCKFRIIILFENVNLKTDNYELKKICKGWKHIWQLNGKCQPWLQTFQSENNLLEQSWCYTIAKQPHKKTLKLKALKLYNCWISETHL